MSKKLNFPIFLLVLFQLFKMQALAQIDASDSASIEKARTQSGVDPTRVQSRISYSFLTLDKAKSAGSITNRVSMTLGVNRWSFAMKY